MSCDVDAETVPLCSGCSAEMFSSTGFWTVQLTTPEGIDCARQVFCLHCLSKLMMVGVAIRPEGN